MAKHTTTDTSDTPADVPTTEQVVQPPPPEPVSDSFGGAPIGDSSLKDPVIINR